MESIQNTREEIPKVLFWINIIFLVANFFTSGKGVLVGAIITNIIFLGSYYVIGKFGHVFNMLMGTQKLGNMTKKLNTLASR